MNAPVAAGATLCCSCGLSPSQLVVPPRGVRNSPGPVLATVQDCLPLANIPPFGICASPVTPSPLPGNLCMPVPVGLWPAAAPGVLVAGIPALAQSAVLPCQLGGMISIVVPGTLGVWLLAGASAGPAGTAT